MPIRRRSSQVRRQANIKRKKYDRLVRNRPNKRLTTKPRSANQRRSVQLLKAKGFYRKIAKLRERDDIPLTRALDEAGLAHSQAFIDVLVEQSLLVEGKEDQLEFLRQYRSKDPWYTQTKVGLCAVALEAYMISENAGLAALYLESIVDGDAETFYVVFTGKLSDAILEQLEKDVDFADFDILVEAGDEDIENGTISDVTVVEVAPNVSTIDTEKLAAATAAHQPALPGADDYNQVHTPTVAEGSLAPQTEQQYAAIRAEGGLSENALSAVFQQRVIDRAQFAQGVMAWEDPNGVRWTLGGDKWLPLDEELSFAELKASLVEDSKKYDPVIGKTIAQQIGNAAIFMMGAKNFMGGHLTSWSEKDKSYPGLGFKIGRNSKGVTHINVLLKPSDEYLVEFLKIRGTSVKVANAVDGVQVSQLRDTIEANTELRLSMGTSVGKVAEVSQAANADATKAGKTNFGYLEVGDKFKFDAGDDEVQVKVSAQGWYKDSKGRKFRTGTSTAVVSVKEEVSESVSIEDLKHYAIPGKSVIMPDNHWWTIESRDMAADQVVLRLSDYAKKDGAKDQPNKNISWTTFVKNAGSTWGINIDGKHYGREQDKMQRAKLRDSKGLRKAPGTPVAEAEISADTLRQPLIQNKGELSQWMKELKITAKVTTGKVGGKSYAKLVGDDLAKHAEDANGQMVTIGKSKALFIPLAEDDTVSEASAASFHSLKPVNGAKPYLITFSIDGKAQSWVRYGKDMEGTFKDAKAAIAKEWPEGKVTKLAIHSQQGLGEGAIDESKPPKNRSDLAATQKEAKWYAKENKEAVHILTTRGKEEYRLIGDAVWKAHKGKPGYTDDQHVETIKEDVDDIGAAIAQAKKLASGVGAKPTFIVKHRGGYMVLTSAKVDQRNSKVKLDDIEVMVMRDGEVIKSPLKNAPGPLRYWTNANAKAELSEGASPLDEKQANVFYWAVVDATVGGRRAWRTMMWAQPSKNPKIAAGLAQRAVDALGKQPGGMSEYHKIAMVATPGSAASSSAEALAKEGKFVAGPWDSKTDNVVAPDAISDVSEAADPLWAAIVKATPKDYMTKAKKMWLAPLDLVAKLDKNANGGATLLAFTELTPDQKKIVSAYYLKEA